MSQSATTSFTHTVARVLPSEEIQTLDLMVMKDGFGQSLATDGSAQSSSTGEEWAEEDRLGKMCQREGHVGAAAGNRLARDVRRKRGNAGQARVTPSFEWGGWILTRVQIFHFFACSMVCVDIYHTHAPLSLT